MPELYTYIRDRLSLMPSVASMKRQHLKVTLRPQTSGPRNYTFTTTFKPMVTELRSSLQYPNPRQQWTDVEKVNKDNTLFGGIIDLFSGSDSPRPRKPVTRYV